jgi:predicted dehydrogenase
MRFFQEHEYVSLDFTRQDVLRVRVDASSAKASAAASQEANNAQPKIDFEKVPTAPEEPLRAELRSFLECVRMRKQPIVDGAAGRRALELADRVMAGILEHARHVQLSSLAPQDAR